MESKWTEAIHTTPQPEPGILTERALAQAPQKSRRALRPYAYGSLALAATLPLAFFVLKKASTEAPTTITESPTTVTKRPTTAKVKSMIVTPQPMTEIVRPTTAHVAPTTTFEKPMTAHAAPMTASVAPRTVFVTPTTVLQRPMTAAVLDQASALNQRERDDLSRIPLAYNLPPDPTNPIDWNFSFLGGFSLSRPLELSRNSEVARASRNAAVLSPEQATLRPRVAIVLPGDAPNKFVHPLQQSATTLQAQRGGIAFQLSLQGVTGVPSHRPSTLSARVPTVSFIVASVTTEPDGSLVLLPSPCTSPMEEILKNPKLRDYTQIKLTPTVVAALKAKGITEFVGKSIEASGKSESVLYLSRPAFEVTTVTVEKPEDIAVTPSSLTTFKVAFVITKTDGTLILRYQSNPYLIDEVKDNPKLRDYTQIMLTPSVVAALKAKGITKFVGKTIQATGKTEKSLYLSFPAFEVTTITVERPEDIQLGQPTDEEHG